MLLCQMPEGADVEQLFEIGFILHIEDDVLGSLDLCIGQDSLAVFAIDVHRLIHRQGIFGTAVRLIHRTRQGFPVLQLQIQAAVAGKVVAIHVAKGDRVNPGEILIEIEG